MSIRFITGFECWIKCHPSYSACNIILPVQYHSVNQDACWVQARARIDLDDQKALEMGMASLPESFEASYSDIFVPALASVRFERLGVDDTHQKD